MTPRPDSASAAHSSGTSAGQAVGPLQMLTPTPHTTTRRSLHPRSFLSSPLPRIRRHRHDCRWTDCVLEANQATVLLCSFPSGPINLTAVLHGPRPRDPNNHRRFRYSLAQRSTTLEKATDYQRHDPQELVSQYHPLALAIIIRSTHDHSSANRINHTTPRLPHPAHSHAASFAYSHQSRNGDLRAKMKVYLAHIFGLSGELGHALTINHSFFRSRPLTSSRAH